MVSIENNLCHDIGRHARTQRDVLTYILPDNTVRFLHRSIVPPEKF